MGLTRNIRTRTRTCSAPLLTFLVAIPLLGQAPTGEISGTVYDMTGGVLVHATVTVTNAGTGYGRTLSSNQDGRFTFPSLTPGPYELRVDTAGFRELGRPGGVDNGATRPA